MKKIMSLASAVILTLCMLSLSACGLLNKSDEEAYGVATTSVAILEILDEMEYEEVVGIPVTSDDVPNRYNDVQTIGAPMSPDFETLVKINPEVVLVPSSLKSSLDASFKTYNLNVVYIDLSDIEGMYEDILSLGELLGKTAEAQALYDVYKSYFENYDYPEEQINVLILMCFDTGAYLVATEDTYVGNVVKLAGAANVYGSGYVTDGTGIASISPEDIALKDPDIIFIFAHYNEDAAFATMEKTMQSDYWKAFKAVAIGNVYYLPQSEGFSVTADLDWQKSIKYIQSILSGNYE